jgi:uncharacterized protein (TIGR02996 family)
VSDEDAFHAALDANPEDWQCRLVFADWLDERGDPRGPGYRTLGARGAFPDVSYLQPTWFMSARFKGYLPFDWIDEMKNWHRCSPGEWVDYLTRREAEDAAALAFAELPAARRAELLAACST